MIFVASTSGVNLYKSICSCTGEETISFFRKEHNCVFHKRNESNSDSKTTSCCAKKKLAKKTKNCCSTTTKYLKVKSDFDATNLDQLKSYSFNLKSIISENISLIITFLKVENNDPPDCADPPLLSGKNLVYFLHQIKIGAPKVA